MSDLATLVRDATHQRAVALADLHDAQHDLATLRDQLRNARLDLNLARELLAYHGLTPPEETT